MIFEEEEEADAEDVDEEVDPDDLIEELEETNEFNDAGEAGCSHGAGYIPIDLKNAGREH